MKSRLLLLAAMAATAVTPLASQAGDLGINVVLSGEIAPGVYGQVELGNKPAPRVVYEQPRVIVVDKRYRNAAPIYLHVPPGHAKHWDKHCHEYNACSRKVYFVRSSEYDRDDDRDYDRRHDDHDDHRKEHGNGHGKGHKH